MSFTCNVIFTQLRNTLWRERRLAREHAHLHLLQSQLVLEVGSQKPFSGQLGRRNRVLFFTAHD